MNALFLLPRKYLFATMETASRYFCAITGDAGAEKKYTHEVMGSEEMRMARWSPPTEANEIFSLRDCGTMYMRASGLR